MRRITLNCIALIALASAASASDLPQKYPVKAPLPAPLPRYDWSGLYLGGYIGSSIGESNIDTPGLNSGGIFPGFVNITSSGWSGGVTGGYNWQFAPAWLIGVEGDFGYLGGSRLFQEWDDAVTAGERNTWYGTARGRFGYVTGPSLLYVTGGVGFVHVIDTFGGFSTFSKGSISSSAVTVGGTVGAGIETKLSRNWTTKTEYLYIDGGNRSFGSDPYFATGAPTNVSHAFQVIKTGLNYRFDGNWDGLPFFTVPQLATNHGWSGFYVGGNAGIGSSLTEIHSATDIFGVSGNEYLNGTGFAGGGQIGYNHMFWHKYLLGAEGDFGALDIRHLVADWNDTGGPPSSPIAFTEKTSWYATARVRVGTTTGPALLYMTGGFAWVNLQDGVVPNVANGVTGGVSSKTGTGWTWGGGAEVALDAHWSAKLESLYVNSGSSVHATFSPAPVFPVQFKERFVIVRAGLDYALN